MAGKAGSRVWLKPSPLIKAAQTGHDSSLNEHAVLLLFLEIAVLLFTSLVFGELLVRFGQPAIIGQILAGLILGANFFGTFFPDLCSLMFPQDGLQSKANRGCFLGWRLLLVDVDRNGNRYVNAQKTRQTSVVFRCYRTARTADNRSNSFSDAAG